MNTKVAREGFIQSKKDLDESRERLFKDVTGSIIKTAEVEVKEEKKEDKKEEFKSKMTTKEAEDAGFFKAARSCGWGLYQISDLDGGAGSVWYLEGEYLVKQLDLAGDVVRRVKKATV